MSAFITEEAAADESPGCPEGFFMPDSADTDNPVRSTKNEYNI
jgi:hypothetical protein